MHRAEQPDVRTGLPPFDPDYVSRSGTIARLRASDSRIVVVAAPAGYGKSSFLAEWSGLEDRPVAWVALTPEENDPVVLLETLTAACSRIGPDLAAGTRAGAASVGACLGRATRLAKAMRRVGRPLCICIDDVHLLGADALDVLGVVVHGLPAGSQVVLASRNPVDGLLGGDRASRVARVGTDDLRIDVAGAARIAANAAVSVDAETLAAWVEHCGGWAAGLHMCALLSGDAPLTGFGSRALLSDYLYEECVRRLPGDVGEFLLRTSVLPILVPGLCDAVAESSGSRRILEYLRAHQLFVTLEPDGESFRLHALFREYLMEEALLASPAAVRASHLRAAGWFEARGALPEAIDHRIAGGDLGGAAALVAVAGIAAYESGQVATLERWLREIGEPRIVANPAAVAVIAWFSILAGTDEAAERWGALLEKLPEGGEPVAGLSIASARAMVRAILMRSGIAEAVRDAEYAVALEAPDSPWRDPALQILGSTLIHAGREAEGGTVLEEAGRLAEARANPATAAMCAAETAFLSIERADWASAHAHVEEAARAIESGGIEGYVMSAYVHAAAACVALRSGAGTAGAELLARAMSERVRCMRAVPLIGIPTRLLLARAQVLAGDPVGARMLLAEIDGMLPPPGARGALEQRISVVRDLVEGVPSDDRSPTAALTVAEQRLLPFLQTHLTRSEIAERLFVSKNTVSSQIAAIFRKLGASGRADAVRRAEDAGLLGLD